MTAAELVLNPAYRHAQRSFAAWLDAAESLRQHAFTARAALRALSAVERSRLARWLAWLGASEALRDKLPLAERLLRLDATLARAVMAATRRLPQRSGHDARFEMTSVNRAG